MASTKDARNGHRERVTFRITRQAAKGLSRIRRKEPWLDQSAAINKALTLIGEAIE